ncbi:hypothetical protein ACN27F_34275 [Solwaraspora sp. WMMB335]|uniref:hypothetical protein n=1 Tax=Solwaraspora sp. WMMB335 TaxID=3404118 RepID=UPI003B930920
METGITVRPAESGDLGELASLLAEAFVATPVASWLISDVSIRYTTFLRVFEVELAHALVHGAVEVAGNREGVAVWQSYPMRLDTATDHERAYLGATGDFRRRFAHLRLVRAEHRMAALRLPGGREVGPGGRELVYLAAAPWLRCRRIGAALLDHHHRQLDAAGLVGHTVTDEEYVRDLLCRRGYRTPGPRHLSPAGPPLWSLRRDPLPDRRARPAHRRPADRVTAPVAR